MSVFKLLTVCTAAVGMVVTAQAQAAAPLGLPEVPMPEDNPQTAAKVALGEKLFTDKRLSTDGTVGCATCHDPAKAFTDHKPVSEGVGGQKGTRNAPTVINAAFYTSQFWDGRRPSLEAQAKDPFVNPIEQGFKNHKPVVEAVAGDPEYVKAFHEVFGVEPGNITIDHVVAAIAAFERTVVSGDSPFDRYQYAGDNSAMSESAIRGLEIYRTKGRCADCHTLSQTHAIFTDNDFHNVGVGFKRIQDRMYAVAGAFRDAKQQGKPVDEAVLSNADASELGRFAVTLRPSDIGRFKTPTLRNIAVTAPYMHDGSLKTLEEVVDLYNRGGEKNPFLDGGIRPLDLTDQEKADLVEFMRSLTSPQFADVEVASTEE